MMVIGLGLEVERGKGGSKCECKVRLNEERCLLLLLLQLPGKEISIDHVIIGGLEGVIETLVGLLALVDEVFVLST